jgi:PAS domain S-box-containing protein
MKRPVTPKASTAPNFLYENDARYRLLAESLPQYVWTTDAEGKIDYCNRHFLEYCGLTLEEVQAGRTFEFVHPDDSAELAERVEQSRSTGLPFEHEYRIRRASDGEYRWHFAHSEQFTDSRGGKRWLGIAIDVTSRKQAEFELRDANERLNGILNSISEWFLVLDREWRIQFVSDRVLDFTHRDWSDLKGRLLWDAFPEAAKTEYKPGYEKVMREHISHTFEVNYPLPDGSIGQYQVHAYPTPDGIAALISNITEKRKTEIDLAESKRLLHLVLDSAGVGTWMWNLGTNEITDLAGTANLLGIPQVTSLDQFLRATHAPDRAAVEAAIAAARNSARLESEHRVVMPDGSLRRVRAIGSLLREQKGLPMRMACVITDVTDRNRSDEVRNRLAAIVDSSDDAIISKDLDGIVTSWNTGATQLFGYLPEEIIGQSILTIIPPELQSEEPAIIASLRSGKKIDHYETVRLRKDGNRIQVSLTISPVRDSSGQVVGASKIVRDIGERLRMQEAMIQSEKLAATGRMAAAIAHEINNPLEAVTNLAYLLSTDPTLNDTARNYAERLLEEINRVSDVAKQSLGFFRDNKKPGSFDVCALLDNVVALYRPLLDQRKLRLDRDYTGSCRIFGSSSEIRQVLTNLLRNAIEAVEPGGVIQLRMRHTQSGMLRILVADNGRGISPQTRTRLFQPFVTSKGTAGNGLGLWVSHGIIAKHGGRIQVKTCDIPGRSGTVFAVTLPADRGEKSQDSGPGSPAIFAIPQRMAS